VELPEVRPATAGDRERVVATVVAAFAEDPAFGHFFSGSYAADAPVFAGNLFDHRLAFGTVWVVDGGSAVSMWNPPGVPGVDVTPGLSAGACARLHRYEAVVHALTPTEPHWYLGVLATHPDHAGRRWGRLAMRAGLDRARADGLPACLETATEANVGIYRASGWTVAATAALDELEVTVMRHDPTLVG
jgi:ribosomal protein S18 acetylase RimI-like enzyme